MQVSPGADNLSGNKYLSTGPKWRQNALSIQVLSRFLISTSALVFAFLLVVTYSTFTVPGYGYLGYVWDPHWLALIFAMIVIPLIALFLPVAFQRPGDIGLYILFAFAFVPGMVIPPSLLDMTHDQLLTFQLVFCVCFLIVLIANSLPLIRLDLQLLSPRSYQVFLLLIFLLLFLPCVFYVGFPTGIPGLADVYTARAESSAAKAAAPVFVAYFWGFLTSAINPFLIGYGLAYRKLLPLTAGLVGTLYIYATSGSKSVLLSVGLILIVLAGLRFVGKGAALLILPGFSIMILLARLIDIFLDTPWATAILSDRAFITPGALTGYYYEFFSNNPFAQWGHSVFSSLATSVYDLDPSRIIGPHYFNPNTQANTHMWADGFANFGFAGMLFVSLLAAMLIWSLNSASIGRNRYLLIPVTAAVSYTLASSPLFTAMLTHGVAIFLILIVLLPTTNEGDPTSESSPSASK